MTEGKRPGGLTALAVFNFIFGAYGVLWVLSLALILATISYLDAGQGVPELLEPVAKKLDPDSVAKAPRWPLYLVGALAASYTLLLIASGVGYLRQRKFLGRGLGTTYAVLSIAAHLILANMLPEGVGGGFNLETIILLVYPILTLLLLNVTFKNDFIR